MRPAPAERPAAATVCSPSVSGTPADRRGAPAFARTFAAKSGGAASRRNDERRDSSRSSFPVVPRFPIHKQASLTGSSPPLSTFAPPSFPAGHEAASAIWCRWLLTVLTGISSASAISVGERSSCYRRATTIRAFSGSASTNPRSRSRSNRSGIAPRCRRLGNIVEPDCGPEPPLAQLVNRTVADRAPQPRTSVRRVFYAVKLPVTLQKNVLRQLFGHFAIAQEPQREAEHHRLVLGEDSGEINLHTGYYGHIAWRELADWRE